MLLFILSLILGILSLGLLASWTIFIFNLVGTWKVYEKADCPGWACLIPYYSSYTLYKLVWGNGWFFFLQLIPFGGMIADMFTYFQMGKRFKKSIGFCIGLMLLPWLFIFILGISKGKTVTIEKEDAEGNVETKEEIRPDEYIGPKEGGKKPMVLTSTISGGCYLAITTAIILITLSSLISSLGTILGGFLGGLLGSTVTNLLFGGETQEAQISEEEDVLSGIAGSADSALGLDGGDFSFEDLLEQFG